MSGFNLCSPTPPGFSSRDYAGYDGSGAQGGAQIYGYHTLNPANCRIDYHWPRNSTGAPTYARFDFTRRPTTEPSMTVEWGGSLTRGTFSWGTGRIGIGTPGAGDDYLSTPRIEVQITGDNDVTGVLGRAYRAVFVNTAGTEYATAWQALRMASGIVSYTYTFVVRIDGSTGHLEASDTSGLADVSATVALSGSFTGEYGRWESHHTGGGASGSNQGGLSEGNQYCTGVILGVNAGARLRRPTVGRIGFG